MKILTIIRDAIRQFLNSARWVRKVVFEGGKMVVRDVLERSVEAVDTAFDAVDTAASAVGRGIKAAPGVAWQGIKATPGAAWTATRWTATKGVPSVAKGVGRATVATVSAPFKVAGAALSPLAKLFGGGGNAGAEAMMQELMRQKSEKAGKDKGSENKVDFKAMAGAVQAQAARILSGQELDRNSVPREAGYWLRSMNNNALAAVVAAKPTVMAKQLENPGKVVIQGVPAFEGDEQRDPALLGALNALKATQQAVEGAKVHRDLVLQASKKSLAPDESKMTLRQRLELRNERYGDGHLNVVKGRRLAPVDPD